MKWSLTVMGMASLLGMSSGAAENLAEPSERDYIRFVEKAGIKGAAALETAVVSLVNADGIEVDLVGAVHIADQSYFEALNERFKGYEVVLYELVGGPESLKAKRQQQKAESAQAGGDSATSAGGNLVWVGALQEWMQTKLGLSSQLMEVDYEAENFVHADMDVEGFLDTQKEKKESFLGLWLKAVRAQSDLAEAAPGGKQQPGLAKILEWMMKDDGADELKRMVGREFDSVEALMAGVEGDGGTVIIGERNRVVVEAVQEEMAQGRKRIAVFYGAAHLPDLERRLGEIGFEATGSEWMKAWEIPASEE